MADYFGNVLRSGATLYGQLSGHVRRDVSSSHESAPDRSTSTLPPPQGRTDESLTLPKSTTWFESGDDPQSGPPQELQSLSNTMLHLEESPDLDRLSPDMLGERPSPNETAPTSISNVGQELTEPSGALSHREAKPVRHRESQASAASVQHSAAYDIAGSASDKSKQRPVADSPLASSLAADGEPVRESPAAAGDNQSWLASKSGGRQISQQPSSDEASIANNKSLPARGSGQELPGPEAFVDRYQVVEKLSMEGDGSPAATRAGPEPPRPSSYEARPSSGSERFAAPRSIEPPLALANRITHRSSESMLISPSAPDSISSAGASPNRGLAPNQRKEGRPGFSAARTLDSLGPVTEKLASRIDYGEPVDGLPAAAASLLETAHTERNRSLASAPKSAQRPATTREPVPAPVPERIVKDLPAARFPAAVREHTPKLMISRLDIQVINQSAERSNARTPDSGAKKDEYDSVERRLLGRFDLV